VIRHLVVPWPDRAPSQALGRPYRLLAVSDDEDPALDSEVNRERLKPVDLVVGCGDLSPSYLSFVADSLRAPLVYVRGNHDRGSAWVAVARKRLPLPLGTSGSRPEDELGLDVVGLGWPGVEKEETVPNERSAWLQALRAAWSRVRSARTHSPLVVISHVPPRGYGDMPDSNYHRGFAGYRWLVERLRPALWLHGHVHPAATEAIVVDADGTPVVNVTGVTILDLDPDAATVRTAGLADVEPDEATRAGASAARP
jgi:hypothetical protein